MAIGVIHKGLQFVANCPGKPQPDHHTGYFKLVFFMAEKLRPVLAASSGRSPIGGSTGSFIGIDDPLKPSPTFYPDSPPGRGDLPICYIAFRCPVIPLNQQIRSKEF